MTIETVLPNNILEQLRVNGLITAQEVVINYGDIYYAKDVLSDNKRMLESAVINQIKNVTITENTQTKTILKGWLMSNLICFDAEAQTSLKSGVRKLCDAVSITMGPRGKLVLIEKNNEPPHLTKDGATVAKNIVL